jgi:hypothetical protein
MKEYKVAAVFWEDHQHIHRGQMVRNPDKILLPTLSVGIILKETKKTLVLVSDIERYDDRDDASYLIILRSTITAIKEYGTIKINKLREGD